MIYKKRLHSSAHHFADDTNLPLSDKLLKKNNNHVNHDLKLLCQWISINKLSLNGGETKIIIFKHIQQEITKHLNTSISGQKDIQTTKVKYLGVL